MIMITELHRFYMWYAGENFQGGKFHYFLKYFSHSQKILSEYFDTRSCLLILCKFFQLNGFNLLITKVFLFKNSVQYTV